MLSNDGCSFDSQQHEGRWRAKVPSPQQKQATLLEVRRTLSTSQQSALLWQRVKVVESLVDRTRRAELNYLEIPDGCPSGQEHHGQNLQSALGQLARMGCK
jgi:hypothetical protein